MAARTLPILIVPLGCPNVPTLCCPVGDPVAARTFPILPRVGGRRHTDRGQ